MTMFRKVFSSHLGDKAEGPGAPTPIPTFPAKPDLQADAPNHQRMKTEAILARRLPDPDAAPMAEAPVATPQEMPIVAPEPAAPQQPSSADMAARAAEAHKKMMQSTGRPADPALAETPAAPATDAPKRRAGRARTRLLGFDPGGGTTIDPFAKMAATTAAPVQGFPTGWLVVAKGPGQGQFFPLYNGVAMVGRGEDQAIRLDFGDSAISRQNHAAFAYDAEDNRFYLGHGGKSNIIRLNDRPVLSTEDLTHGDIIRIGETTLRFVALCGEDFQWGDESHA